MLDYLQKSKIIDMKRAGKSTREIARMMHIDRSTVSRYWDKAQQQLHELEQKGADARTIQQQLYLQPLYKREGKKRKFTLEIAERLSEILADEERKNKLLKWDKQRLTNVQIHQMLLDEGYEISLPTINLELAKLRKAYKNPEVYIKQFYEYGKRLEFDFGEVKLDLGEGLKNYHMAVFCAPASNFRWCFLYANQKQNVFLDSHVRFFDMVGGVWSEVVYDNMRNAVSHFEGKNGKKLNDELMKLASYYGFKIKTCNPYSGNEKGSVERSVQLLRNRLFSLEHKFDSIETARKYMNGQLKKLNKSSDILAEKGYLLPAPPPYELAEFSEGVVSKYGFVSVESVRYSVPEHLVGKRVCVKKYYDEIRILFDFVEVCRHKRCFEKGRDIVDISHFLDAFEKKPGAVEDSVALKSVPKLKDIYNKFFTENPRRFIEILQENKGADVDVIVAKLQKSVKNKGDLVAKNVIKSEFSIESKSQNILSKYSELMKGDENHDN